MAYIYKHIRLDINEVFYIGISEGTAPSYKELYQRANDSNRSKFWKSIVAKTDYKIEIVFDNLTWEEAKEKEIELILFYGRRDLKTGTLVNMTNGGDGIQGYKHSEETKKKISESKKGHIVTEEARIKISQGNKGKIVSDEAKKKLSIASKRRTNFFYSEEARERMSQSAKERGIKDETRKKALATRKQNKERGKEVKKPKKEFCSICNKFVDVRNLKRWHKH